LARDASEANILTERLHPARVVAAKRDGILRYARNAIWTIDDPRAPLGQLVIKQPVKMHLHKRLLDRFKPSKALRSWNGTCELLRRGLPVASPVAFFEKCDRGEPMSNYFVCELVSANKSVREMVSSYARGADTFNGTLKEKAWSQLCGLLLLMHGRGIHFRDLSGGNILVRDSKAEGLDFALIDTGRLCVFESPLGVRKRLSDLVRVCNKMDALGRDQFMEMYMERLGQRFSGALRIPFAIYNSKVGLKRRIGRKAIRRLLGRDCS
jgi:hypothetical protein